MLNCKLNFVSTKQAIRANLGVDRRVGPGSDWLAVEVVLDRLYATVVVRGRLGGQRVLLAHQTRSTEKRNYFFCQFKFIFFTFVSKSLSKPVLMYTIDVNASVHHQIECSIK